MPKYRKLHTKTVESLDLNEMPDDLTRLMWVLLPLALCREGRGLHSGAYLQSARVLGNPALAEKLSSNLAGHFKDGKVTAVIGPAMGGIIFAYELARALGTRALFAERVAGKMSLRRGFSLSGKDAILVAEDVITTGGSVKEVIALAKARGAKIVSVCALVDRAQQEIDFGANCVSLLKLPIENFTPQDCPLCRKKIPLVKPGSR